MSDASVTEQYRRFLLVLSAFIFAGSIIELEFIEHYEDSIQYVPFVLCGLGVLSTLAALLIPGTTVMRTLRYAMILIFFGGVFGLYQHLTHNFGFALEISPNLSNWEAFVEALYGASPFLAPGILCLAALLAFAVTWRHPLLEKSD